MNQRRFVLLDRDGTIIEERCYLADPRQVEVIPGAVEGLRQLSQLGLGLAVVTNQSGVARGLLDLARLNSIHDRMRELLAAEGVRLDAIYSCLHAPQDDCACRKPRPGMVQAAASELSFEPREAFVIGDKACDIQLGQAVGATNLLVRTGYGALTAAEAATTPDYVVDNLQQAALTIEWIVRMKKRGDPKPCHDGNRTE